MTNPDPSADFPSPSHLQVILDNAADAYFLHDQEGNLLDVNQIACKMLGYRRDELLNLTVFDIAVETGPDTRRFWRDFVAQNRTEILESTHRHKDGSLFPVELKLSTLEANGNKYIVAFARDISQRKRNDEMLQLTKFAVDHAANPTFWYKVSDATFVYVNEAACDYLGYSRDEMLNMKLWDLNPSSTPEILAQRVATLRTQPSITVDTEHLRKTGEFVPIEALAKLIEFEGEEYIISFVRDVTLRKEHERQLQDAKEKAEHADKMKSQFLANMSHEIRTPLTGIIGFSEALLNPALGEEEKVDLIHTIIRSSKHLYQVINDILDLSKIEADQLEVERIELSPASLVLDIEALMSKRAREKGLAFNVDFQFPLPRFIVSDPVRIKQILLNICGNSIKFTDQGNVDLRVSYNGENHTMCFAVSDTGIGMSRDEVERVFKPFSQADTSTTRKYGGTGLGLSISSELAKKLGGDLRCESVKGQGSKFTIEISAGEFDEIEMIDTIERAVIDSGTAHVAEQKVALSGHILLAEDIPENQKLIAMYVKRTGAQITIVNNGQEAVDAALAGNFDLVLMDSQMPVMDGLQAIAQLRQRGYAAPIVSITANAMKTDWENCIAAGATDYLSKPIELNKFYSVLQRYLKEPVAETNAATRASTDLTHDPDFQEVMQFFLEQLPGYVDSLSEALGQEDLQALKSVAHQLKGMGSSFGLPEITQRATVLEHYLVDSVSDVAKTLTSELIAYCEEILSRQ